MYIGQGVKSGAQRPLTGTFPCRVLYFSSQKRRASGPTTIMPPDICLLKCSACIENDVRISGTFSAIDGPA
jgi:hypothetical protein